MKKYTFIFEFKGGTYIAQVSSDNLNSAINKWANDVEYFRSIKMPDKEMSILKEDILNEEPILLQGLTYVWSVYLLIKNHGCLINIVQTAI